LWRYIQASEVAVKYKQFKRSEKRGHPARSLDQLFKPVQQRTLALQDFCSSNWEREPAGTIDLRKRLQPSALWRPFHLKRVAPDGPGIEIAFGGEGVNPLAAALAYLAQRTQRSRRATSSGSSPGSISPFGIDHAPSSLLRQNGPPGCTSSTFRDRPLPR
jgi:hypothetical protein